MDEHPFCARCGYDLFGSVPQSIVCPECGVDLQRPGALTNARRQRLRRRVRFTLIGFLLAGALASIYVARRIEWEHVKPVWLLQREGRVASTHVEALLELLLRLRVGQLSPSQIDALADTALADQADASRTWLEVWGDFVTQARIDGKLSDQRWKRYVEQGLAVAVPATALSVPATLPRGAKELPVVVTYRPGRMGTNAWAHKPVWLQTTMQATGGDLILAKQQKWKMEHPLQSAGGRVPQPYRVALDPAKCAVAGDGPHTVQITVDVLVSETPDFSLNQEGFPGRFKPLLTKRYTFSGIWSFAPAATAKAR